MADFQDNTPPINATGQYGVRSEFDPVHTPGAVYRAESILGFHDLEERDIDVYKRYYQPRGIAYGNESTPGSYLGDRLNGINIVVLISDNQPTIYIPSSYITSFPTATTVPYSRHIISVDLGLLPDGINLSESMDIMLSKVAEVVGVLPSDGSGGGVATAELHTISLEGGIDFSDHEMLEQNRAQRIEDSGSEALLAALKRQQEQIQSLQTRNQDLVTVIQDLQSGP